MLSYKDRKKNIIRLLLLLSIVLFGVAWNPESNSSRIGQMILIGNIILIRLLMEIIPLWFTYSHRKAIVLLDYFAQVYNEPLSYTSTPVMVIKSQIYDDNLPSFASQPSIESERSYFTINYHGEVYEFKTDSRDHEDISLLASVILYYLNKGIPYELLYEQSKRIRNLLEEKHHG